MNRFLRWTAGLFLAAALLSPLAGCADSAAPDAGGDTVAPETEPLDSNTTGL